MSTCEKDCMATVALGGIFLAVAAAWFPHLIGWTVLVTAAGLVRIVGR